MTTVQKAYKPLPMEHYIENYAMMPAVDDHFRYCPGCGLGLAQGAIVRAFDYLKLDPSKIVTVSGSGCYAVMGQYIKAHQFHGPHGAGAAAATGIKLANPELTVICLQGDGDAVSIGAGHFVHGARRNIDITVIVFNNFVFGETGGQGGPTTPYGTKTETTPYGAIENSFDICQLAAGAGATYVARSTVYHAWHLTKCVANAIAHKGFSVVEVMQNCHELWGRRNGMPQASQMLNWYRDSSITMAQAKEMSPEQVRGKFVIGEFVRSDRPEIGEEYAKLIARVQKKG